MSMTVQRIVDLTFGAGGHSRAILEQVEGSSLITLDRDPLAYSLALELHNQLLVIYTFLIWTIVSGKKKCCNL